MQDNGTRYLVTELLEGESLRSVLQQGQLSERRGIDQAIQIARGPDLGIGLRYAVTRYLSAFG